MLRQRCNGLSYLLWYQRARMLFGSNNKYPILNKVTDDAVISCLGGFYPLDAQHAQTAPDCRQLPPCVCTVCILGRLFQHHT